MFVRNHYPNGLYFDILDAKNFNEFTADPSRLSDRIPEDFNDWIIVDEIQKVPALLNEIHRLIEQRNLHFVLTGSSSRRLKNKHVNLPQTQAAYPIEYLRTLTTG